MIFPSYFRLIFCELSSSFLLLFSSFFASLHCSFLFFSVTSWHSCYRHCVVICNFWLFFFQLSTFVSKAYTQLSTFHAIFKDILTQWSKSHEEKELMVEKLRIIVNNTRKLKNYTRTMVREHYCQVNVYPFIVFIACTLY